MALPQYIPIKDLEATSGEYDAKKLQRYWALYAGGSDFAEIVDQFIIKREIEKRQTEIGIRSYDERKKLATYVNRLGGFVDGIAAEITREGVKIEVEGGTEEQKAYWEGLNRNCDGYGTPFAAMVRKLLVDGMVSRDAWCNARADDDDPRKMYLSRVNPVNVIDWVDGNGEVTYAKIYRTEEYRDSPYMPSKKQRCQWVLFLPDGVVVYEAYKEGNVYVDGSGAKTTQAEMVLSSASDYGMQTRKIRNDRSQWVVDRVADTVILLFNKSLDQSFALYEAAYPQLVLTVDDRNNLEGIIKSELNIIVMEGGEKIEYLSPNKDAFTPLSENIESLKAAIHETIQSMARDAASVPQAGRMSGETVREMRSPLAALQNSIAWPVYETLMGMIDDIKKIRREEELSVDICGLIVNNEVVKEIDTEDTEEAETVTESYEGGESGK